MPLWGISSRIRSISSIRSRFTPTRFRRTTRRVSGRVMPTPTIPTPKVTIPKVPVSIKPPKIPTIPRAPRAVSRGRAVARRVRQMARRMVRRPTRGAMAPKVVPKVVRRPSAKISGAPVKRPPQMPVSNAVTWPSKINRDQAMRLIKKYFPEREWDDAYKVMRSESGGSTKLKRPAETGGVNYGLFQINDKQQEMMLRSMGMKARELTNPEKNIMFAAQLFSQYGWSLWESAKQLGLRGAK